MAGREDMWAALVAGPERARAACAGVEDAELTWKPSEGDWSVQEVINHLADSELVYATRVRWFIAQPGATVHGYDQDAWARELHPEKRDARAALELFCAVREDTIRLLEVCGDEVWAREGIHSERGPLSVEQLVASIAGHAQDHGQQIHDVRAAWRGRSQP